LNNPEKIGKRLSLYEEAVGQFFGYESEEEGLSLLIGRLKFYFDLDRSAARQVTAALEKIPSGSCIGILRVADPENPVRVRIVKDSGA